MKTPSSTPPDSPDNETLRAWLPAVIDIAIAAGRDILRVYEADFDVTLKRDRSPLTEADLAAQRTIGAGLATLTPEIGMLGEESAPAVFEQRRSWHTLWLVDPLDGTREFVKRNGEFTVNIALVHQGNAVLGVVYAPVTGVAYAAARGSGAFRRDAEGHRTALHVSATAPETLRVLASRSHGDAVLDRMLERLGTTQRLSVGSALKFGLLAEGAADLYVRRGSTCEWDTAAGHAVVLEAGGAVVDFTGRALRYNERDTLINPSFIAYADASQDWVTRLGESGGRADRS
ncbi:MAG TPA: 3'(2'),5'-bisphosphate nucleotidase CysQ [Steroidobacteraceae bacterium]|jgi:3'(2'), 5'-bisphosphate nucleotidase|nr:3'(2'),5'-bisphosphate nucleotidase CysQ [Steroidobacteraceae bacterium]